MSELHDTLRESFAALAAADPNAKRFGAKRHRYQALPPIDRADLPTELRAFAKNVSGGGVGPYYGLLPLDRIQPIAAPRGVTAFDHALPIAHLGCGYAALITPNGEIWIDARAVGLVAPIYASFDAYMIDWIDRLSRNELPEGFVPPGRCALAHALSAFLELERPLDELGPGAIQIANEGPLFEPDVPVDPCVTCARLLDQLGLAMTIVREGVTPLIER
ncbi:MAG: SMI1/KNR4 family protein [Kofleriaceae bacterium]